MVSLTSLTTSLIVAFLVSTSTAAPSQLGHRQVDSSVFDFTLYETPAPNQAQCFNAVDVRHIAPGSLTNGVSACFTENFYTVEINDAHTYGCRINVFDNASCSFGNIGSYNDVGVCHASTSGGGSTVIQLRSWQVTCSGL